MRIALRPRARTIHHPFFGWYIALGGAVNNFFVIGVVALGFGVFIQPMREELGWSVAAISFGVSLRSFQQGLMAPLTGTMVDRLGPRRMAVVGLAILTAGLLLFSQARTLPVFYLSSVLLALGQSLGSLTPFSAMLMNWFRLKRGRALGILNTGNGAGYLATPVLALLMRFVGWRPTLIIAAIVIFAVGMPLTTLLRDRPSDRGLLPDGEDATDVDATGRDRASGGMGVREALRTPAFYLLVLANASAGTMGAWIVLQVPHLQNVGFSRETAALLTGLYGVIQITLRFGIGWLGDRFGRKRLYAVSFLLQGIGLVIFANLTVQRLWLLPLYYGFYASGHATWVVFQQTMVADYFGVRRFATLSGFASAMQLPVGIGAPVIAGLVFDRYGTYAPIFTIYGIIAATGTLWIMLIRRPRWSLVDSD